MMPGSWTIFCWHIQSNWYCSYPAAQLDNQNFLLRCQPKLGPQPTWTLATHPPHAMPVLRHNIRRGLNWQISILRAGGPKCFQGLKIYTPLPKNVSSSRDPRDFALPSFHVCFVKSREGGKRRESESCIHCLRSTGSPIRGVTLGILCDLRTKLWVLTVSPKVSKHLNTGSALRPNNGPQTWLVTM